MKSFLNNNKNVVIVSSLIIILALAAAMLTLARVGLFSRFQTDDYYNLGLFKAFGYFQSISQRYNSWDGRYAFSVVIYFFSSLGVKFPSILPLILIILCYGSAFYFFQQVSARVFQQTCAWQHLLLAGFFTFLLLYTIPSVGQDVFWMTGSSTYFLPISLDLLLFGAVIRNSSRFQTQSGKSRILFWTFFFLASFFISGFSEVITTLHLSISGMVFLFEIWMTATKRKNFKLSAYWAALLFGALLGFVIMVVAPGNQVRESVSPAHPGFLDLFTNSLKLSGRFTFKWFFHYSEILWPTSVILTLAGIAYRNTFNLTLESKDKGWLLAGFVLVSMLFVFITFVPAYWALSKYPENRVLIIPTAILCVFVVLLPFMLGSLIQKDMRFMHSDVGFLNSFIIIMILFYAISSPIYQARKFYFQTFPTWQRFAVGWDNQHASILEKINNGERRILTKKIMVDTIGLEEFTADPNYWVNTSAAQYYGVDEIAIE